MQGKILIVDAIATNRIVLKVKLASAYYHVLQAATIDAAVALAAREAPDLVVCALDLSEGGVPSLCEAMRAAGLDHLPVLAIGADTGHVPRMAALAAGAHDVLVKPVEDAFLLSRVRSLIRAHHATSEWRLREDTSAALGLAEAPAAFAAAGHVTIVAPDNGRARQWSMDLRAHLRSKLTLSRLSQVLRGIQDAAPPDAFVLAQPECPQEAAFSLGLISTLRANAATRHAGVLVLQQVPDATQAAQALDLGADDVMTQGFDAPELALRVKAIMRRKRIDAQLRDTFRTGLKAAVHDPLTGLYNRRYAMPHLARIAERARQSGKPYAVMVADLDHFKRINDTHGHAAGDAVLVEVARRLRAAVRDADMVARIGGEEFLIVMPGTTPEDARVAAVRICNAISAAPFILPGDGRALAVTISIGMAIDEGLAPLAEDPDGAGVLGQADKALYSAKLRGRNRVTLGRPAA